MYDDCVKLMEMPQHNSISVCVFCEKEGLLELGERINAKHEEAYMNGYGWDALIRFYVGEKDPALMEEVESDPEAGMYSGYMKFSPENLAKMKRFEAYVRELLADEKLLMEFVDAHCDEIEWD